MTRHVWKHIKSECFLVLDCCIPNMANEKLYHEAFMERHNPFTFVCNGIRVDIILVLARKRRFIRWNMSGRICCVWVGICNGTVRNPFFSVCNAQAFPCVYSAETALHSYRTMNCSQESDYAPAIHVSNYACCGATTPEKPH